MAQQYQRDETFDPKFGAVGIRVSVTRMAKDPALFAQGQAQFNDFFNKYYFPAMTRPDAESLAELGKLRYELFSKFLWVSPNPEFRKQLTELARVAMGKQILNPAYHPAVRYNAVLVMGMLDADFDGKNPPTPLPQATKVLTYIVDTGVSSEKFPPTLILGALIGLERHAQYRDKMDPASIPPVTAALLKLIDTDEPIQEMDSEAYAWLRSRAASVLAQFGSVGPNGEAHAALMKLIANDKSLDNRTAVAGLLDKLTYKDAKIDGKLTVDSMLKLAGELAAAEGKRAKDFETAGVGGGGGFSPEFGAAFTPGAQTFPRQQVLARVIGLRRGLRAVKPALDEKQQAQLDEIDKLLEPVIKAAGNKDTGELALTDTIRKMANRIAQLIPAATPLEDETPAEETADPLAPAANAPAAEAASPAAGDIPPAAEPPTDAPAPAPQQ